MFPALGAVLGLLHPVAGGVLRRGLKFQTCTNTLNKFVNNFGNFWVPPHMFYLLVHLKHNGMPCLKKRKLFSSEKVTWVNNAAVNDCNAALHDPHDWDEELGQLAQRSPVPTFRPTVCLEVLATDRRTFRHQVPQSMHRLDFEIVNQGIKARFRAEARNFLSIYPPRLELGQISSSVSCVPDVKRSNINP